jgi:hypothetical protein
LIAAVVLKLIQGRIDLDPKLDRQLCGLESTIMASLEATEDISSKSPFLKLPQEDSGRFTGLFGGL